MNKYIFALAFALGTLGLPVFASAQGLTIIQIQSIISILTAFGVDGATIARVNADLTGNSPATMNLQRKTAPALVSTDPIYWTPGEDESTILHGSGFGDGLPPTLENTITVRNRSGALVEQVQLARSVPGKGGTWLSLDLGYSFPAGIYSITVQNDNGTSNTLPLLVSVTPAPPSNGPSIMTLSLLSGTIGDMVTITGSGFAASNDVLFNGNDVATNLPSQNGTTISFTIPSVKMGTYEVSVQTAYGTSNAHLFLVFLPSQIITAIVPAHGTVGSIVSITGTGFDSNGNEVTFNGLHAATAISNATTNMKSNRGTISFTVPKMLTNACFNSMCRPTSMTVSPGQYTVSVHSENTATSSNALPFTVDP